jgi:hypothetical protein
LVHVRVRGTPGASRRILQMPKGVSKPVQGRKPSETHK